MEVEFQRRWSQVQDQVFAHCRRAAPWNVHLAEEAFQQTAIRAFRGYATLRDERLFLPWVLTIAQREVARCLRAAGLRRTEELPETLVAPESSRAAGSPAETWMTTATLAAVAGGQLTELDGRVLIVRVRNPELTWGQIGATLEPPQTGNACAARHCRAIVKLRVFLFLYRQDLLGGRLIVAEAFEAAVAAKDEPLGRRSAAEFRSRVIEGDWRTSSPGWYEELCAACERVIRYVPLP